MKWKGQMLLPLAFFANENGLICIQVRPLFSDKLWSNSCNRLT